VESYETINLDFLIREYSIQHIVYLKANQQTGNQTCEGLDMHHIKFWRKTWLIQWIIWATVYIEKKNSKTANKCTHDVWN